MDEKTLEALKGSIQKWEMIVAGTGMDRGIYNCPLCQLYFFPNSCAGCPVAEKVGHNSCDGTPYVAWSEFEDNDFDGEHFEEDERGGGLKAISNESRKLAQDELDFLRSLLPNEGI